MFCTHCGHELPDGAQFCNYCGTRLDADTSVQADQFQHAQSYQTQPYQPVQPVQQEQPYHPGQPMQQMRPQQVPQNEQPLTSESRKSGAVRGIIIAVISLLVIAGAVFAYITLKPAKTFPVMLSINAEGLDTSTGSKVPIRVVGTTAQNESVDKIYFFSSESSDCELSEGTYTFTVAGSPIAADGTIYNVEDASIMGSLSSDGSLAMTGGTDGALTLTPIAATEVSDEQIDEAYSFLTAGGAESEEQAEELKNAAMQRRDDALAQKAADEAAAEQAAKEAEEAKKAAEAAAEAERTAGVNALVGTWSYVASVGGTRMSMEIDSSGTATITAWSSGTGHTEYYTFAITSNGGGSYTFTATSDGTSYPMTLSGDTLDGDLGSFARVS